MTKSRKKFDAAFKAKVALEAARGFDGSGVGQAPWCASEPDLYVEEAGAGRCRESFRAGRERLYRWRGRARAGASKLYAKIGQLTVERDFLAKRPGR
jgi:transposase